MDHLYEKLWSVIRAFGYTTRNQTDDIVDAIIEILKKEEK